MFLNTKQHSLWMHIQQKDLLKRGHVRIMYNSEIGLGKIINRAYYTSCFTLTEKQFAFQEECQSESQRPWSERFGQE